MTQSNKDFYKNLQAFDDLKNISQTSRYEPLPDDWYILATDIKGSTKAIEEGKYKDVNMVGALTIISILNIDRTLDIPFVFGGDGAFLLIPPLILNEAKQSLLSIEKIALEAYGLTLRIGVIPVWEIYKQNKQLLITKYKISKEYTQVIIKGGGLELCDHLLKQSDNYRIKEPRDPNFQADIEGLECRWQAIPTSKQENLSILIKADNDSYYEEILKNLETILGDTYTRHPIVKNNMRLSYSDKNLNTEASIYTKSFFKKQLLLLKFRFINLIGLFLMSFQIGEWGSYKKRIIATTDTEKFDDMLRMTVSTDFSQTQELEHYLQEEYQKGRLYYGIHKTDSSLMTCLIFERHGKHIHFVDGSDGGYAMAAKMLKKQLH